MKTKLQILEETYNYYSNPSNRGYDEDTCRYITQEGKMCAVGRICINPQELESQMVGSLNLEEKLDIDKYLKEEYLGHGKQFWVDLQGWHDNSTNFEEGKISENGEERYKILIKDYAN